MAPSSQRVEIAADERVFVCGMTGSGKTFWSMHMLAACPRLIVIDNKHSDEIDKWTWDDPDQAGRLLERGKPVRVRVQEDAESLQWAARAFEAGNCILYVDEINLLIPQGTRSPVEIQNVWRAGRERGVGAWVATQRPSWLPRELISEAEWSVCFRLKLEDDRKTMAANGMGPEVLTPITDEHGFYISRVNWQTPKYYKALDTSMKVMRENAPARKELAHA